MILSSADHTYKIAVIVTLYNKELEISRCIYSVAIQSLKPDILVIVDDKSTDNGLKIAKSLKIDIPVLFIENSENVGPSIARNIGVNSVSAEYIAFLDADDYWLPNFLEEVVLNLKHENASFCATSYFYCYGDERFLSKTDVTENGFIDDFFASFSSIRLPFVTSSVCMRQDLFKFLGGFKKEISLGEDIILWSSAWQFGGIFLIKEPLVCYSLDANSSQVRRSSYADIVSFLDYFRCSFDVSSLRTDKELSSYNSFLVKTYVRACLGAALSSKRREFDKLMELRIDFCLSPTTILFWLYWSLSILPNFLRVRFANFILRCIRCLRKI
ncbi:glycosyltransferase family 2 protein [Sessilibacter sp. MAH4]